LAQRSLRRFDFELLCNRTGLIALCLNQGGELGGRSDGNNLSGGSQARLKGGIVGNGSGVRGDAFPLFT
jgi:hypothetical protein